MISTIISFLLFYITNGTHNIKGDKLTRKLGPIIRRLYLWSLRCRSGRSVILRLLLLLFLLFRAFFSHCFGRKETDGSDLRSSKDLRSSFLGLLSLRFFWCFYYFWILLSFLNESLCLLRCFRGFALKFELPPSRFKGCTVKFGPWFRFLLWNPSKFQEICRSETRIRKRSGLFVFFA